MGKGLKKPNYHCDYCRCPIEIWEPLKTYKVDRSCELFSDFYDVIWDLEETKKEYNYKEVYSKCLDFKDKYSDIPNFKDSVNEMIEIGLDTGIMINYVKRNVISLKN